MDWLKNFLTPFYERVKSPLYSTFIISWLIVNWKVIFAVFTSAKTINGCSKFDYLSCYLSILQGQHFLNLLIFPAILTAIYIYLFPLLDGFIFEHVENIKNKRREKKLDILKKYKVSGNRFVDLLGSYNSQKDSLAKLEIELGERKAEIIREEEEYKRIKEYSERQNLYLNYYTKDNLSEIFNNIWVVRWNQKNTRKYYTEFFSINSNKYQILDAKNQVENELNIDFVKYNHSSSSVEFLKINFDDKDPNRFKKVRLNKSEGADKEFYTGEEISILDNELVYNVQYMSLNEFRRRDIE